MFDRLHFHRRLPDGSPYIIRPSGPADRGLLIRCFEALSPASRRMRFFSDKPALTQEDLERLSSADGHDHIAFAAVRLDALGRETEPLGFARCLRLTPGGEVAEFSIATVDAVQGQGVGTALLTHLIPAARRRGIRRFWFEVLAGNTGMRRLAQRLEGTANWLGDGVLEYDCALPAGFPAVPEALPLPPDGRPLVTEFPEPLPWYLVPGAWAAPWVAPLVAGLDRYLDWSHAANEDEGPGLGVDTPAGGWREAA